MPDPIRIVEEAECCDGELFHVAARPSVARALTDYIGVRVLSCIELHQNRLRIIAFVPRQRCDAVRQMLAEAGVGPMAAERKLF